MRKTVSVSFEGEKVKIVYASFRGNTLSVTRTAVISDDEFESYLQKEKTSEFIAACHFNDSSHDIISVPSTKAKYLHNVVESEIRKSTGKRDFSFLCIPLNEKTVESRKVLDVFFYAVNNIEVRTILDRFYRCGKSVRALYPSVFAAASLIDPAASGEARMGVMGADRARTVFFTRDGTVQFIRNYDSIEADFGSFDVQNVNMTINYCFQNLRLNPSAVLLMGNLAGSSDAESLPTAPLSSLMKPDTVHCTQEEFNEFTLPMASCFTGKASNIMSREFQHIYLLKKYMSYAAVVFIAVTVLCSLFIFGKARDISARKELISQKRANMQDMERVSAEYNAREEAIGHYRPLVAFLNRKPPQLHRLLNELSRADNRDYKFSYLAVRADGEDAFIVTLNGTIFVDTFSSLQDVLATMTEDLKNRAGVTIRESTMEAAGKTFRVVMEYRNAQ